MNEALVIIDMQKEFYKHNLQIFEDKIIPNLKKVMEQFRLSDKKIIHIATVYKKDKSDWPLARKNNSTIWCLENTEASELIEGFSPQKNEPLLIKKRFSSFFSTGLQDLLEKNAVNGIILAGYSSDVCLRQTAIDAYNRNISVKILKDCTYSDHEDFEQSLDYLTWLIKCEVI